MLYLQLLFKIGENMDINVVELLDELYLLSEIIEKVLYHLMFYKTYLVIVLVIFMLMLQYH